MTGDSWRTGVRRKIEDQLADRSVSQMHDNWVRSPSASYSSFRDTIIYDHAIRDAEMATCWVAVNEAPHLVVFVLGVTNARHLGSIPIGIFRKATHLIVLCCRLTVIENAFVARYVRL